MNTITEEQVTEVERGIKTCQCKDCKADAKWKVRGIYYCGRHFALLFAVVST